MTRPARQPSHPGVPPTPRAASPAAWPAPAPSAAVGEGDARRDRDARLARLLAATAAGDAGAFEAFYEATFAYARTVARRLLRDNAAIEDLLSDCYFEAWRCAARFDAGRGSPVTWLLTLVRSRGLDALRAAASRPDRPSGNGPAGTPDGEVADAFEARSDPSHRSEDDPAETLWRRQAGAELHAALAALSAPERWVLGLAYLRELSHTEISRCTGMPLGTVKSHALRAQNKLRARLAAPLTSFGSAGAPSLGS